MSQADEGMELQETRAAGDPGQRKQSGRKSKESRVLVETCRLRALVMLQFPVLPSWLEHSEGERYHSSLVDHPELKRE